MEQMHGFLELLFNALGPTTYLVNVDNRTQHVNIDRGPPMPASLDLVVPISEIIPIP